MKFQDIYQFFENPPPIYLNKELAVCYVLAVLLQQDSYGTELIKKLASNYHDYRLSDTVLYSALKFLEVQEAIDGYWQKVDGRGRPRRMYRLNPDWRMQAEELAELWLEYMKTRVSKPTAAEPAYSGH
ncbi:MAG: PadR family transcriptional regulator [Cyanobacteria bacterium P01_D01_bin.115]